MDVDMVVKARMKEIKEAMQKNVRSCEVKIIDVNKEGSTDLIVAEAKLLGAFLGGDATIGQLAGVIEQYKIRLRW